MAAILSIGFTACSDNDDESSEETYVITAELVSSSRCPAEFVSYVKSLCNAVYTTVNGEKGNANYTKRLILSRFNRSQTEIMQALQEYDVRYKEKYFNIAFYAKNTSGKLKYQCLMIVGGDHIRVQDIQEY